jgi:hypothetical protein
MFQLTSVPVLSDVTDKIFSSTVLLTPNDNFWIVPLLHSVNDIFDNLCNIFTSSSSHYKTTLRFMESFTDKAQTALFKDPVRTAL